jgi:hypothetical protein
MLALRLEGNCHQAVFLVRCLQSRNAWNPYGFWVVPSWSFITMVTLSEDEVALLRAILTALRAIKVREIDKALVILSKGDR